MRTNYVFIDYENIQVKSLDLLMGENFRVYVFLGPNNTKLPVDLVIAMQQLGERAVYITFATQGNNALDFHIAYYIGVISANDPNGYFHIISKDTGFDSLIQHLKSKKIFTNRSISIEEMPCFSPEKLITAQPIVNKQKAAAKLPSNTQDIDSLVKIVLDDLISRKKSKPRAVKTLRNTINAKLMKLASVEKIDIVYNTIIKNYVKINNTKLSYSLPEQ
ncbi:Uncharacterized protein dnl_26650 [Desulfonema limicola]|uniref:PIN-like domain-containing protein n=1 Tax=Desulfonema limicola TaxID=45656 RepID=A0A975B7N1_9BACT|nr:PIN domain-containing protein [Desulfonema limicola]QTA80365.1 Uncharacterized protein dnl_26650 [Desulfonema limicola]